jgi:hypothetical protein
LNSPSAIGRLFQMAIHWMIEQAQPETEVARLDEDPSGNPIELFQPAGR